MLFGALTARGPVPPDGPIFIDDVKKVSNIFLYL